MLARFLFKCCSKDSRAKDVADAQQNEIGGYGYAYPDPNQPTMLSSYDGAPPVPPTMLTTYGMR